MSGIQLIPVQSSQIAAYGYDTATKTLEIRFVGKGQYQYPNVEPETVHAFANAESMGKYFAKHIRNLPNKKLS